MALSSEMTYVPNTAQICARDYALCMGDHTDDEPSYKYIQKKTNNKVHGSGVLKKDLCFAHLLLWSQSRSPQDVRVRGKLTH